jgi:hypothetical protein
MRKETDWPRKSRTTPERSRGEIRDSAGYRVYLNPQLPPLVAVPELHPARRPARTNCAPLACYEGEKMRREAALASRKSHPSNAGMNGHLRRRVRLSLILAVARPPPYPHFTTLRHPERISYLPIARESE